MALLYYSDKTVPSEPVRLKPEPSHRLLNRSEFFESFRNRPGTFLLGILGTLVYGVFHWFDLINFVLTFVWDHWHT